MTIARRARRVNTSFPTGGPERLTDDCNEDQDCDQVTDVLDIDDDHDGLIEIDSVEMLNNVRFVLNGTGYQEKRDGDFTTAGCPRLGCHGYELTRPIDMLTFPNWQPIGGDGTYSAVTGPLWRRSFQRHI